MQPFQLKIYLHLLLILFIGYPILFNAVIHGQQELNLCELPDYFNLYFFSVLLFEP
jgi:hypothetical protein